MTDFPLQKILPEKFTGKVGNKTLLSSKNRKPLQGNINLVEQASCLFFLSFVGTEPA